MKVKFKKLHPEAVIPKYAKPGDAGLDLTAVGLVSYSNRALKDGNAVNVLNRVAYRTGLAVEIPKGYVGLIFPRSSIFKKNLRLSNCVGVVDSGYRGEIAFHFDYIGKELLPSQVAEGMYKPGDRIGQLVIMPYPQIEPVEAEELSASERGADGWGSTGA